MIDMSAWLSAQKKVSHDEYLQLSNVTCDGMVAEKIAFHLVLDWVAHSSKRLEVDSENTGIWISKSWIQPLSLSFA